MRKIIKIKFVDFWEHWDQENNFITDILRKYYDVNISEEPDYVFFSNFNPFFDHMKYQNCVKIFYTQENLCPDFNFADYGIGFEYLEYGDRYLRFPICFIEKRYGKAWELMKQKHIAYSKETALNRQFCSFVVSNGRANEIRRKTFEKLSVYQKVNSGGKYMNNMGNPQGVPDKILFESKHKFSICFENTSHPGYMTEKLIEAFAAGTVPIYWGDPLIGNLFNKRAFVCVNDFATLDAAIQRVIEIDQNDDLYMEMLATPALVEGHSDEWQTKQKAIEAFLCNIIEQDYSNAYRRNREFWGSIYTDWFIHMRRMKVIIENNMISQGTRKLVNFGKNMVRKIIR